MTEAASGNGTSIVWRRLDRPGHEAAVVTADDSCWAVSGSAVFVEASRPVRLDYRIVCDETWKTRSASVWGWIGKAAVDLRVVVTDDGEWLANGVSVSAVNGCVDIDLNFSPSTNLLPIRRLNLAVGEAATVKAAWLRFPSLKLEVLDQVYRRRSIDVYDYESAGGAFRAELRVNEMGFPVEYASIWVAEASA